MTPEQVIAKLELFKLHVDTLSDGRDLILTDGTDTLVLAAKASVGDTEIEQHIVNCIQKIRFDNIQNMRHLSKLIQTRIDELQSPLTFDLSHSDD